MTEVKGHKVKVEYTGTLEDGTVFDSSEKHGQPLEFVAGIGQVVPGFDKAICEMQVGQEKEITLQPDEAYGMPNDQFIQKVPADKLPEGAKEGDTLAVGMPNGHHIPAKITKVENDEATIDMNPPLAGKVLNFKLKLVEVGEKVEEKEACGDDCGCHH